MSGQNRAKKAGARPDKKSAARKRDFEQPIVGSDTKQPGRDISNFTDGNIAGPDWKRKQRSE